MMGLHVTTFSVRQWRDYRALRLRALEDSPDAFASTFEEALVLPERAWRARLEDANPATDFPGLLLDGGRPSGLCWGRIEPGDNSVASVYQMWVAPESRRQGAGIMLLEAVLAWAASRSAERVELEVTTSNRAAWRLYERRGFEPVGEPMPLRKGSNLTEQTMVLRLR